MMQLGPIRWTDILGRPVWRWAEVTDTTPTVQLTIDGDTAPVGAPPTVLAHVGTLTVGDRVWAQISPGGAIVVLGKAAS